jgi:hypothetical protein
VSFLTFSPLQIFRKLYNSRNFSGRSHPHSFCIFRFPRRPSQFTQLKGGCMAISPNATRPSCVLGTPACPQCKDTALVANGGFLTCPTCALAITRQALLQEALNLCLATEPQ